MELEESVTALAALAHESRLAVFRLLVEAGPDGLPAGTIADQWLEEALVATIPGEGFGSSDYIRFSFAASSETIDEGLNRLAHWISQNTS